MENTQNNPQEDSKVVARVNGKEIKRKDLDFQIQKIVQSQQFPVPKEQTEERKKFEQEELNHMINSALLAQDAEKQEFRPKQEEVDAQYSVLVSQVGGEEKLNQALQNIGITAEQLREDMTNQIMLEHYFNFIKEKNEIVVTDEEVKAFYEAQVVPQDPKIEFTAVEPRIRQALEQQKLNQPLSEIIQNLRKEAEITISL
jgi:hypothetical protein